ncbi:MAG: hypothetical protein IPH72_07850 [Sandaracinaceae bacterium]|nr:hypothetical protein [Sandaracinaceae bacterium]
MRGKATAPVLFDGGEVLSECWDIAQRAEAVGARVHAVPEGCREGHPALARAWPRRVRAGWVRFGGQHPGRLGCHAGAD